MGWTQDRSLERAKQKWDETEGLEVTPIVRETDFAGIALKSPRLVTGAHGYLEVANFKSLLKSTADADMARLFHLWARAVTRVISTDFDAVKIHFQGPRVHIVAYRPVNDGAEAVARLTLVVACIRRTTRLFNAVHELTDQASWVTAGCLDHGEAVATKNGVGGDRELLFLGDCANQPAKNITTGLQITTRAAEMLPEDLASKLALEDPTTNEIGKVLIADSDLESLVSAHGGRWTADGARSRLADDATTWPAGCATIYDLAGSIDKEKLGLSNTKRVEAISLFADIDGFTAYVATQQDAEKLPDAVRAWHVIRSEMRTTLVGDYNSLRIQYQGDRMQGLVYEPLDDKAAVVLKGLRVAAALQSATRDVLPDVVGDAALPLAVGLALGSTLVSRLGETGNRDVVCLSLATAEAARIQQRLAGGEVGIDSATYDLLPPWLTPTFAWNSSTKAYVTKEQLTLDLLERLEAADSGGGAKSLLIAAAAMGAGVALGAAASAVRAAEPRLRPYAG